MTRKNIFWLCDERMLHISFMLCFQAISLKNELSPLVIGQGCEKVVHEFKLSRDIYLDPP